MVAALVILTFAVLVLIDIFIFNRSPKRAGNLRTMQVFNTKDTIMPKEYYYSKGHTWVNVENENKVKVGLDGFILNSLGSVLLKNVVSVGKKVKKGDILFESLVNNVSLRFRSPMNGTVTEVNNLEGEINDPEKWCVSLKPDSMKEDISNLISSSTASKWVKSEFRRLKDLLIYSSEPSGLATATMYDGGNIAEGAIKYFDENVIKDYEELFLKV
jgi:glycine cleavage system H lipoate-binding protein